ncbi:peptidylprolyl isomerase [Pontixanthobacter rizhaonensis]|nr:peptidylprolyl isomerase [Pontixanthobacter rizhaonensis]
MTLENSAKDWHHCHMITVLKQIVSLFVLVIAPISLAAQPVSEPVESPAQYSVTNVVLETSLGDLVIALETERAPITANNFLRYVDEGRLDGTVFYRRMELDWGTQPNGLIQGGTQFDPDRILLPIPHERTTDTGVLHLRGALSMARNEPGTATGDFSIMLQDAPGMNANPDSPDPLWQEGYAAFGYVTSGMDIVEAIHAAPTDPDKGEGWMKGQMLAEPVMIMKARRADTPPD